VRAIKEGLQGNDDLRQEVADKVSAWFAGLLRSQVFSGSSQFEKTLNSNAKTPSFSQF
jgi:hypothetical protein